MAKFDEQIKQLIEKEYWQQEKWIREKQQFIEENETYKNTYNPLEIWDNPVPFINQIINKEFDKYRI